VTGLLDDANIQGHVDYLLRIDDLRGSADSIFHETELRSGSCPFTSRKTNRRSCRPGHIEAAVSGISANMPERHFEVRWNKNFLDCSTRLPDGLGDRPVSIVLIHLTIASLEQGRKIKLPVKLKWMMRKLTNLGPTGAVR
jgi:hypothetical protein